MKLAVISERDLRQLLQEAFEVALRAVTEREQDTAAWPKQWLTNAEAQDFLGLSRSTLQRYRDKGLLPYSKLGANIYYRYDDIVACLENNMEG